MPEVKNGLWDNVSSQPHTVSKGSRIGQLVITPVIIADFVTYLGTERGTGGFGSTGEIGRAHV